MYIHNIFDGVPEPENLVGGQVAVMECLELIPERYKQKINCDGVIFTNYSYLVVVKKIDLLQKGSHIVIHEYNSRVSEQTVRHSFADSFARLFVHQNKHVKKILGDKAKSLPRGILGNGVTAEDLFVLAFASIVSELNKKTGLSDAALSFFRDVDEQIEYEYIRSTL